MLRTSHGASRDTGGKTDMTRSMQILLKPFLCTVLLGASLTSATFAMAQSEAPVTLVDAWLSWQQERQTTEQQPFDWAYSFALRQDDAAEMADQRARLIAEIDGLGPVLAAGGQRQLPDTLARWAQQLRDMPAKPARSAEPLGLLTLAGALRRNPPMADIATFGTCRPPEWVEAWTLAGVKRIAWRPGLTVSSLLDQLPAADTRSLDTISLVSPRGETRILGVAAWNRQNAALAPGARIVAQLPEHSLEARLINRELAAFLATRLPGDDCTLWPN
ncbi:hypothetical protein C9J49_007220 [Halomonas sp. SL1]|nr:hypothetical protein C9J49_007220 [Halomonas sp. SL1]